MTDKPNMAATPIEPGSLEGRILVAEDCLEISRFIAWVLRRAGAQVDVAANGREAIEKFSTQADAGSDYQLVLTDIEMPEIGGFELVELLRARGTNVPIVALTALDRADDRQEVLAAGCNDYLIKPAEKWELVRVCQQWMGKPAPSNSGH